ncbi:cytochrome c [Paraburkholderia pallida]|uniref:Cytochrome c n=2 Tax=Paraburkholderia pallida TaxID=2547399 RepID=A0A4P7D9C7_9BURK|nr:cytochrome c [Paraburkholderia pallida]
MKAKTIRMMSAMALAITASASFGQTVHYTAGQSTFGARCAVCHQAGGKGQDGLAPPLTRYPGRYAATPDGRQQLTATVLNGMYGEIAVQDKTYNFKMPSFASLSDEELAEVLNYVVFDLNSKHGNAKPFTAAELKAARDRKLDASAVHASRAVLTKSLGL